MALEWKEMHAKAAAFAERWKDETRESSESQTFYNEFFAIFGVDRKAVAAYQKLVRKTFFKGKYGFIDLFWPGVLLIEHKSAGRNLSAAREQANEYCASLPQYEKPQFILLSDFKTFELLKLESGEERKIFLAELPNKLELFKFIYSQEQTSLEEQDPVNVRAATLMGELHECLAKSGYDKKDLERLLVRLVFCLFAEDINIFPAGSFENYIQSHTKVSIHDFGGALHHLFDVLDTPVRKRSKDLDKELRKFPYVNGGLFEGCLQTPSFTEETIELLKEAARSDWSQISPAIFGALFQSVMDKDHRREFGSHYTTEENILKTIGPLFLNELRAEFNRLKLRSDTSRKKALLEFQEKLSEMTFFDPACGCGNFLIITYRELRRLEMDIIQEAYKREGYALLPDELSCLGINQFYGIEIEELPVRIAETAMWMMDALMNQELSEVVQRAYERLPLRESAHIYHGDALKKDWGELLSPEKCTYVFGNPPFGGSKLQSPKQRQQVRTIAKLGGSGGTLDFVAAWFIKAGVYLKGNQKIKIAFVATNSITQGEQVGQLWPILYDRHQLEITFAHRTFAWGSEAKGKANVHVVIVGFAHQTEAPPQRRLFFYRNPKSDPEESFCTSITPDLKDGSALSSPHLVIKRTNRPLNGFPKMLMGSKPVDDGIYILKTEKEKEKFLKKEPNAASLLRPFIGGREFLNRKIRYILYLAETEPHILATLPEVEKRMEAVRQYRQSSEDASIEKLHNTPTKYHITNIPNKPFLFVPRMAPERREYVVADWLAPPVIPSDQSFSVENATKPLFALLTSAMHMTWLRAVGGRLGNSPRYSVGIVYNTFPLPTELGKFGSDEAQKKLAPLTPLADAILEARTNHKDSTLTQLYNPNLMPPDLRKAHQALDKAVDKLYRPRKPFTGEADRRAHLLKLYEQQIARLIADAKPKRARRRRLKS